MANYGFLELEKSYDNFFLADILFEFPVFNPPSEWQEEREICDSKSSLSTLAYLCAALPIENSV